MEVGGEGETGERGDGGEDADVGAGFRSRLKCWRLWFAGAKIVVESVEGGSPG